MGVSSIQSWLAGYGHNRVLCPSTGICGHFLAIGSSSQPAAASLSLGPWDSHGQSSLLALTLSHSPVRSGTNEALRLKPMSISTHLQVLPQGWAHKDALLHPPLCPCSPPSGNIIGGGRPARVYLQWPSDLTVDPKCSPQ